MMGSPRSSYPQVDPRAGGGVTAPVREIPADLSLGEARALMVEQGVPYLAARLGQRVGLVERPNVERALAWDLGKHPVALALCLGLPVVKAEAPEVQLRRCLLRAPRVLVGTAGRWLGVAERHSSVAVSRMARNELGRLPRCIQRLLATAGRVGDEQGVSVALVGGAVRDLLLGSREVDLDLVIEGDGLDFARRLGRRLSARVTPHRAFLTTRLTLPDGRTVDVATARRERYSVPGCLPRVEIGTLLDDLRRRDFTINAMALLLNAPRYGAVEDPLGGMEDLRRRVLRVIHPLSFIEDPTRVFRAARFAARSGLRLTHGSLHLARQAMALDVYHPQAFRRLGVELALIVGERDPPSVFRILGRVGGLRLLTPTIRTRHQLLSSVKATLTWYARIAGMVGESALALYLLGLTQGLADAEVTALLDRLGLASVKGPMEESRRAAPSVLRIASRTSQRRASRIALGLRSFAGLTTLWAVVRARGKARVNLRRYLKTLRHIRPTLTGDDLRRMGIPPGPAYSRLLDALLAARVDGRVASRREEVHLVRELIKSKSTRQR